MTCTPPDNVFLPFTFPIDPAWPESLKVAMERILNNFKQGRSGYHSNGGQWDDDTRYQPGSVTESQGKVWWAINPKPGDRPSPPRWSEIPLYTGKAKTLWGVLPDTLSHGSDQKRCEVTEYQDGSDPTDPPITTLTVGGIWTEGDEITVAHGDDEVVVTVESDTFTDDVAAAIAAAWGNLSGATAEVTGSVVTLTGSIGEAIAIVVSIITEVSGNITEDVDRAINTALVFNKSGGLNLYAFYGIEGQLFKAIYNYEEDKYYFDWIEPWGVTGQKTSLTDLIIETDALRFPIHKIDRVDGVAKYLTDAEDDAELEDRVVEVEECPTPP